MKNGRRPPFLHQANQRFDTVPGETEMLVKREFRSQLEEVLPEKIGVSRGFVVDSAGGVSRL